MVIPQQIVSLFVADDMFPEVLAKSLVPSKHLLYKSPLICSL